MIRSMRTVLCRTLLGVLDDRLRLSEPMAVGRT